MVRVTGSWSLPSYQVKEGGGTPDDLLVHQSPTTTLSHSKGSLVTNDPIRRINGLWKEVLRENPRLQTGTQPELGTKGEPTVHPCCDI